MRKRLVMISAVTLAGVLVLLLSIFWGKAFAPDTRMTAKQGKMDVALWDIGRDPVIRLDGEWEFYWNKLLTTEDFQAEKTVQSASYRKVPSLWSEKQAEGTKFPAFGCATYRLVLEQVPFRGKLVLKKVNIRFSSRIYVNGRELITDGIPAQQTVNYRSGNTPQLGFFENNSDKIEIIVQVANYEYLNSGIPASLELGREDTMLEQHQRKQLAALLIFAALCMIALFHLIFFIITRDMVLRNPVFLLFSLFCFLFAWGNGLSGFSINSEAVCCRCA
ncbi:MAG: signal transduction histidine kinase, LytS [Herbinix sp.]|nr:signal transduction histidine kinase, LytS [Herbinix sp.]